MIQPAALPAIPGLSMLGDVLPASTVEGMEGADFGALLAIEAGSIASPGEDAKLPAHPRPDTRIALQETAVLPESGKDLPLALPVEMSAVADTPTPQPLSAPPAAAIQPGRPLPVQSEAEVPAQPPQQAPAPGDPGLVAVRTIRSALPAPAAPDTLATESDDGEVPADSDRPAIFGLTEVSEAQPGPIPGGHAAIPVTPAAPQPAPGATPRTTPRAHPSPAALIASHHIAAAPLADAEPRELPQPAQTATQPTPAPITLKFITVPFVPASRIGEPQPRLTLPAAGLVQASEAAEPLVAEPSFALPPAIAAERRQAPGRVVPVATADLALPVAETIAPAAALAAPAVLTGPAPSIFIPVDPALRPHDFTQLVDRLVAARELAAPQAFQVAVQHGEFGQVQLRFRHEGDGLTISLASADPDFARVVSAASAPVLLPLTTTDLSAAQGGPRSDNQSQTAASNGHSAQNRGGSPERREDRNSPAENPAPARQGEGRGSRRSGIFA